MTDAERAALLAALMDDGVCEFKAQLEVERIAADLAAMAAEARVRPVFNLSGKAAHVREMVAAYISIRTEERE